MGISDNFCGQKNGYSVSKTIRFELKPVGKTQEFVDKQKLLSDDFERADAYGEVKQLIDDFHRHFIAEILQDVNLDWTNLANILIDYQINSKDKTKKEKLKKELTLEQNKMRKSIVDLFKKDKDKRFEMLFKKELFEVLLPEAIKNDTSGLITQKEEALQKFNKFSTYFVGFHENRKNIYSSEEKSTAISYRVVNENFIKFIANMQVYEYLSKNYPQILLKTEEELSEYLNGIKLKDVFTVNGFNKVISQKGIDFYNTIIGGIADDSLTIKKQGINEAINLARQQLPFEEKNKLKKKMTVLYKQILSDKEKVSFIPESFVDSKEVYDAVKSFSEDILKDSVISIEKLFSQEKTFNLDEIFVPSKELTSFSQKVFGSWSILSQGLFEVKKGEKNLSEKKSEELTKKIGQSDNSFTELQEAYNKWAEINGVDNSKRVSISSYFNLSEIRSEKKSDGTYEMVNHSLIAEVKDKFEKINFEETKNLQQEKEAAIPIKDYLDAVQNLYHYIKLVDYKGESLKDETFYADFDSIMEQMSKVVPLYNKTRNFVTKKIGESKKIKLNFNCSNFLSGWGTEYDTKAAHLFIDENKYYLGIINKKLDRKDIDSLYVNSDSMIDKVVYDFQKPDNKNTPRIFIRSKGTSFAPAVTEYNLPIESIIDIYDKGLFKTEYRDKNPKIYAESLIKMIDYFKLGFSKHESYKHYKFCWKDSKDYNDISEFYADTIKSCYEIKFEKVNKENINCLVDSGKLFLFQIYNKDYSDKSTGNKNMHTLYWENLFSKENLQDVVLQLNGQAELFYRPAVKDMKITSHAKGSWIVNRTYLKEIVGDKQVFDTIPEDTYQEIYKFKNGKISKLSEEAQKLLDSGKVEWRQAPHDIIKDKHFTKDKYLFHCPITMNFKAPEITGKKFNSRVLEYLKGNPTVKIIGLDRGERNLIYLSLINQKGEIELQKTLNLVNQTRVNEIVQINYQEKLVQKEGDRDKARKNWQTIGNIKELKEGYLSGVVHEIAKLMVENNAIIVMEDLNFGFKRGRFAVERQVYQKFEQMLIDKLNYLAFKDKKPLEVGGILNAYQLTDKFSSFKDLGKQCGWLFYIPAGYTSKIDPTTGFANLLPMYGLTNVEKKKNFFDKFDSIHFDKETDSFVFGFDYDNFGTNSDFKKKWEVYTREKRLVYNSKNHQSEEKNPTDMLVEIFSKYSINYTEGENLIDKINEIQATRENVPFFDALFRAFSITLQMRNSKPNSDIDYLVSPVKSEDGTFFDSRNQNNSEIAKLPIDADANGAYHIALKGLYLLKNNFNLNEKGYIDSITNVAWFKFVQNKEWIK